MTTATESVLQYRTKIWAQEGKRLAQMQRRGALRVSYEYRTLVSWQTSREREHRTSRFIPKVRPRRRESTLKSCATSRVGADIWCLSPQVVEGADDPVSVLQRANDDVPRFVYTFFVCDTRLQRRSELDTELGHPTPENIVDAMVRRDSFWDRMSSYTEAITSCGEGGFRSYTIYALNVQQQQKRAESTLVRAKGKAPSLKYCAKRSQAELV